MPWASASGKQPDKPALHNAVGAKPASTSNLEALAAALLALPPADRARLAAMLTGQAEGNDRT